MCFPSFLGDVSVCSVPTPSLSALSSLHNSPCHSAVTSPEIPRRHLALKPQRLRARPDVDALYRDVKQLAIDSHANAQGSSISAEAPSSTHAASISQAAAAAAAGLHETRPLRNIKVVTQRLLHCCVVSKLVVFVRLEGRVVICFRL